MTQRARGYQRLKNLKKLCRLVSHDIWPKVRKRIHRVLRNGENRQPCRDPEGREEIGEKRRSCVAGVRAPSIEMNHRSTIPIDTRDLDHLMSGILEEFRGVTLRNSVRIRWIGIVSRPPRKFSRQWGQKFNGDWVEKNGSRSGPDFRILWSFYISKD